MDGALAANGRSAEQRPTLVGQWAKSGGDHDQRTNQKIAPESQLNSQCVWKQIYRTCCVYKRQSWSENRFQKFWWWQRHKFSFLNLAKLYAEKLCTGGAYAMPSNALKWLQCYRSVLQCYALQCFPLQRRRTLLAYTTAWPGALSRWRSLNERPESDFYWLNK